MIKPGLSMDDEAVKEAAAVKSFNDLSAAEVKKIKALTQEIEDKTARSVDDAMKLSVMKEDLEDTQESLDIIRILKDDDDALELFKKSLPAPALTQTQESLDTIRILND